MIPRYQLREFVDDLYTRTWETPDAPPKRGNRPIQRWIGNALVRFGRWLEGHGSIPHPEHSATVS